jgi:DNA-binding SARP family transcriptional activator
MDERSCYLKILGSFEIEDQSGTKIRLPRGNLRWILASLILEVGQGISEQRLIEQVWGPRGTSLVALRSAVSRLRGWAFDAELASALRIEYTGTGYQLRTEHVEMDAAAFKQQFAAAARLEGDERFEALLGAASFWRESALADAPPGLRLHPVTADLDHRRSQAAVELAQAARQVGRTTEVLEILRRTAHDMPYDEPLQAAFLIAANEAGLRTEAVRHFGALSKRLATELGVAPSADRLRAVRADGRSGPAAAPTLGPPRGARHEILPQNRPDRFVLEHGLPRPVVDFVGRGQELATIRSALVDERGPQLVYVMGPPGIGKTELCLKVAQELRSGFGLRVLYASLGGSSDAPAAPHEVMCRFVHAMEPASETSGLDPHLLAARYQSLLSQQPTLVVLDDAAGSVQLRPLLPLAESGKALINGRLRAPALTGLTSVPLCRLATDEGAALLASHLAAKRVAGAEPMLLEIVDYLDAHPLALRTAGLRLAAHPHWTLAWLRQNVSNPRTRLAGLSHDGLSVRKLISDAFERLPDRSAAMLLDLHQSAGATRSPGGGGRIVIDISTSDEAAAVDELVARWILEPFHGPGPVGSGGGRAVRMSSLLDAFLTELEDAALAARSN